MGWCFMGWWWGAANLGKFSERKNALPCNPLSSDNQHFTKTFFKVYTLNCLIISNLKILCNPCVTL
jgi:hypothetical protein